MIHPTFYFFDDAFGLTKRIEGRRGVWKGDVWHIEEVILLERAGWIFRREGSILTAWPSLKLRRPSQKGSGNPRK
jgi:hypothetical protein